MTLINREYYSPQGLLRVYNPSCTPLSKIQRLSAAMNKELKFSKHLSQLHLKRLLSNALFSLLVHQTVTTLHHYPVAVSGDLLCYIEGEVGSKTSVTGVV